MYRKFMNAKIHLATVTDADVNYEGSIAIDRGLLKASGMKPYEWVSVFSVDNGARIETYIIPAEENSGIIQTNGAAAHLIKKGHRVIIIACKMVEEPLPESWTPVVLLMNEDNSIKEIRRITEKL
jgi:aspartate 1-decarboxylase